jgi:hypothetical protein
MTENFEVVPTDLWDFMSEEDTEIYDEIAAEEGEPISPVYITEDGNGYEMIIEDHDTGEEKLVTFGEGSLHDWFGKSKSKGGKPGWVQSDGSPCANEKGETGTPKCYSSKRLSGLKKSESGKKKIRSADARKSAQDSGQQSKSGGAKPTMVRTFTDPKDYKKHSSGDGKTKKEEVEYVDEACWKGYTKKGMKTMFGKKYPNCVKKEEYASDKNYKAPKVPNKSAKQKDIDDKFASFSMERPLTRDMKEDMSGMSQKSGDKRSTESGAGMTAAGVKKYNSRTGGNLKTAVTTPPSKLKAGSKAAGRRKSFCARSRGWNGERGKAARRRWNC